MSEWTYTRQLPVLLHYICSAKGHFLIRETELSKRVVRQVICIEETWHTLQNDRWPDVPVKNLNEAHALADKYLKEQIEIDNREKEIYSDIVSSKDPFTRTIARNIRNDLKDRDFVSNLSDDDLVERWYKEVYFVEYEDEDERMDAFHKILLSEGE